MAALLARAAAQTSGCTDLVLASEQFFDVGGMDRGQNRLCRNSATGTFTCEDLPTANDDSYGVAIGSFGSRPVAPALAVSPNPARGAATLTLMLDATQTVSVAVLDVLGREIARLHDGPLAAGAHALPLDTPRLPPGVYVVRAATPAGVASRCVTVVR